MSQWLMVYCRPTGNVTSTTVMLFLVVLLVSSFGKFLTKFIFITVIMVT